MFKIVTINQKSQYCIYEVANKLCLPTYSNCVNIPRFRLNVYLKLKKIEFVWSLPLNIENSIIILIMVRFNKLYITNYFFL